MKPGAKLLDRGCRAVEYKFYFPGILCYVMSVVNAVVTSVNQFDVVWGW